MNGHRIDGAQIATEVLGGLKAFQRRTVDHVFRRMYDDTEPARRFLVADEVGLGKTLVARGLIAKAIERLQRDGIQRIDVIYICSNADIARQNIQRLNVTGQDDFSLASRITLLPLQLHRLNENGLNFVSFTPGTSFTMASRGGRSTERAVLFHLLRRALGSGPVDHDGAYRLLTGSKGLDRFRGEVRWVGQQPLDNGLAHAFEREIAQRPELIRRFVDLSGAMRDPASQVDWNQRWECIRELRQTLARGCVEALEPDLVILDEFQRFRELLQEPNPDDPDDIRALAHHLFAQKDVRILLLSATPYKMYTLSDESDDDHYADFLQTTRFLMSKDDARAFGGELREFRRALLDLDAIGESGLRRRKTAVERRLRGVMVRTERLAVTADRSGMLADRKIDARLTAGDVRTFAMVDRLSRKLATADPTDYWKSSPYMLNFMESYQLKRHLRDAVAADGGVGISEHIDPELLLPRRTLEAYGELDPGNARLRGIVEDLLDRGAWRLLWLPASLPYYTPGGHYADPQIDGLTKRLIFSSWAVVPPAVSAILSYGAERQMMRSRDRRARNTAAARARQRGLLQFRLTEGEAGGMSTFGLIYPSLTLTEIGDPLAVARRLRGDERLVPKDEVVSEVRAHVERLLRPLTRGRSTEGPEDERWYWAAPLLLDRSRYPDDALGWLRNNLALRQLASRGGGGTEEDDGSGWTQHIDRAIAVIRDGIDLGRVPADLADALTDLAIAGFANCGARATARILARARGERVAPHARDARDAGARIAWGLRSLFNVPEVMALVRGPVSDEGVYWRSVLQYALNGNLQAVLDEYAHVLPEWLGLLDRDAHQVAERVSAAIAEAVSVRAVNYIADDVQVDNGTLRLEPMRLRVRFAMRFGTDQSDEERALQRSGTVRAAFNSPFWPVVLTSTSVGQEGLDFHQYCHAVVHWNLPANPVDLEQREGRVHRYKGHAVRKNVAVRNRVAAFRRGVTDPWASMFEAAARSVTRRELRDIEPYWVYEGPARIERQVPLIPLSREVERLERLKRSLAVYRMVFGQPRQEDLLALIQRAIDPDLLESLRVDLSP
jgi:hypothetical protein